MRALVTGAAGFIGSHVVRALVERGADVHVLVRPTSSLDRLQAVRDRFRLEMSDLSDPGGVSAVVRRVSPDLTFHLAWYAEPGSYINAVPENLRSLEASSALLRSMIEAGSPRVVLAGTCLEFLHPSPRTIYAAAKRALHVLAEQLNGNGISAICAHIFHLYGPLEDERRVIPQVIRALLQGKQISVTAGEQERDYLHVCDVAAAICTVADSSLSGTIDICSGRPVTLREVFDAIGREVGRPDLIRLGGRPYDENETFSAVGDAQRLRRIGWSPAYALDDGIKDTVAWWSEHERQRASNAVGLQPS